MGKGVFVRRAHRDAAARSSQRFLSFGRVSFPSLLAGSICLIERRSGRDSRANTDQLYFHLMPHFDAGGVGVGSGSGSGSAA